MTLTLPKLPDVFRKPDVKIGADDLPDVIRGRVTWADINNSDRRQIFTHCAVATALKRMYPALRDDQLSVATSVARIDGQHYEGTAQMHRGVLAWCVRNPHEFDFELRRR